MAKEAKELKDMLTEEQRAVLNDIENDKEIDEDEKIGRMEEYTKAAIAFNKLNAQKGRINRDEVETLLDLFKYKGDSIQAYTLGLNETQTQNLVESVVKIKDPELAYNVARENKLINDHDANLTVLIGKNTGLAVDYAVEYYKKNNGKDVRWCFDLVMNNVKKDLTRKKPKNESYEPLARFIYETQPGKHEDETELNTELYEPFIKGVFADKLFGTDEEINEKDEKESEKKAAQKEKFISELKKAIVLVHEESTLAKLEAQEVAENEKLESDPAMKKHIDEVVDKKFHELHKKDFDNATAFRNKLKAEHPKDYDAYLKKLRSSRTYKKAFKKYSNLYAKEKEDLRKETLEETKEAMREMAQNAVLNKKINEQSKEKPKEEEKAETL